MGVSGFMISWNDPLGFTVMLGLFLAMFLSLLTLVIWQVYRYKFQRETDAIQLGQLTETYKEKVTFASVNSMEQERTRIAAELHDGLINDLRRIQLGTKEILSIKKLQKTISNARKLSHELMPPMISFLGLASLIDGLLEPYSQLFEIDRNYTIDEQLSDEQKLQIYRILQELLSNTDKHARASSISVRIKYSHAQFRLVYQDNGIGCDPKTKRGLGLSTIKMRTSLLTGNVKFKFCKNGGTRCILRF